MSGDELASPFVAGHAASTPDPAISHTTKDVSAKDTNSDDDGEDSNEDSDEESEDDVKAETNGEDMGGLEPRIPTGHRMLYLGVHRVIYSPPPPLSVFMFLGTSTGVINRLQALAKTLPSVGWFLQAIYSVNPTLSTIKLALDFVESLVPTFKMYVTNRMLTAIEVGMRTNNTDTRMIATFLAIRWAISPVEILMSTVQNRINRRLHSQIKLRFRHMQLLANLAKIRGGLSDDDEEDPATSFHVYRTASDLLEFSNTAVAAASETVVMYRMLSSSTPGSRLAPMMLATWIIRALPSFGGDGGRFWSKGYVYHTVARDYIRLSAVQDIAGSSSFRQELMGLNLGPWLIQEFERCRDQLWDIDLSRAYVLLWESVSSFRVILSQVLDEWPTLYYVLSAIFGWANFSFATISSVQSQSWSLQWKFEKLFGTDDQSLPELLNSIHEWAEAMQIPADPDDNALAYPHLTSQAAGMALEFRDVTFNYPSSKSKKPAVSGLSFVIHPGQLVVLVGENGSGKTSLTKLLTRLLEPSSGTIYIDGQPATDFKHYDLREATAFLSQDHCLFDWGFSVAEDIGLGRWQDKERHELIDEALRLGGAHTVVSKFKHGSNTVLSPLRTKRVSGVNSSDPLRKFYDKLERSTAVSGGEKQRLVAARTFMRMNTGDVKLVVVDEPSAAMDPAGEYELFKNLREARAGKTMIFITHRFGHLTKHADLILCMKDGRLAEQGTHAELITRKGEYFNLYNVQAQAFTSDDA